MRTTRVQVDPLRTYFMGFRVEMLARARVGHLPMCFYKCTTAADNRYYGAAMRRRSACDQLSRHSGFGLVVR